MTRFELSLAIVVIDENLQLMMSKIELQGRHSDAVNFFQDSILFLLL